MRKTLLTLVIVVITSAWIGQSWAALCPKCKDAFFIPPSGKCSSCGKETDSGALKLCPKCSAEQRKCESCLQPVAPGEAVPIEQPPAEKPSENRPAQDWRPVSPPGAENRGAETPNPGWRPVNPPAAETPTPSPPATPPSPAERPPERLPEPPLTVPVEKPLTPIESLPEVKTPEARPAAPARIDPAKPGMYTSGKWEYQLDFSEPGTRSEGRWGRLSYDGKNLTRGEVNDYYLTPWGPIYRVGVPQNRWGVHGWMTSPSAQANRRGRCLNPPAKPQATAGGAKPPAPGSVARTVGAPNDPQNSQNPQNPQSAQTPPTRQPQVLEVGKADSGKRARVYVGNVIVVRLPGNPPAGFQWQAAANQSRAVRLVGKPQFAPAQATPGTAASGGTYTFQFQAVQPGATAIKLYYMRPGDRTRPPAQTFTLAVDVFAQPAKAPAGSRTVGMPADGRAATSAAPGARVGQGGLLQGVFSGR